MRVLIVISFMLIASIAAGQSPPQWTFAGRYKALNFKHEYMLTLHGDATFEVSEIRDRETKTTRGTWMVIGYTIRMTHERYIQLIYDRWGEVIGEKEIPLKNTYDSILAISYDNALFLRFERRDYPLQHLPGQPRAAIWRGM
jgi:hypothetical protein